MNEIKLTMLGLLPSPEMTGSFDLFLQEVDGSRQITFPIGMFEAQAIAIVQEDVVSNRPMTHDLITNLMISLGFTLEKILVCAHRKDTYYAKLIGRYGAGPLELDARPSDAIAIALRLNAPLFIYEFLLGEG